MDLAAVQSICRQRIREKAVVYAEVHKHVSALVTTLAGHGVRLAVVSNGFQEDIVGWPDWSQAHRFSCAVFSCTERLAKPDPEIYRRAADRLGVAPAAAVYIGDGGDDELAGAERAGLRAGRAAWFVPDSPRTGRWPELAGCKDALRFIEAG